MVKSALMFLSLVRLLFGLIILSFASLMDWRTRRVGDIVWAIMGTGGVFLFALETNDLGGSGWSYLVLLPFATIFLDTLWERGRGTGQRTLTGVLYAVAGVTIIVLILTFPGLKSADQTMVRRGFGALFILLLAHLFYYLGLMRGGADAKAFMAIGILVPGYPSLDLFPLIPLTPEVVPAFELFFPFALSTLMNSALLLLTLPVYFLARNAIKGDFRWPQAFLGFKTSVDALPPFVWALQEAQEDGVRYYVVPRRDAEDVDLERLRSMGIERIWVSPQIPFMIPMTAGYLLTFLAGNLLFGLL